MVIFIFSFTTVAQGFDSSEDTTLTKVSTCRPIEDVESGMSEVESATQRSQTQRLLDGQSKAIELNGILSCLKAEGVDTNSLQTQLDDYANTINKKLSPDSIAANTAADSTVAVTTNTDSTVPKPQVNSSKGLTAAAQAPAAATEIDSGSKSVFGSKDIAAKPADTVTTGSAANVDTTKLVATATVDADTAKSVATSSSPLATPQSTDIDKPAAKPTETTTPAAATAAPVVPEAAAKPVDPKVAAAEKTKADVSVAAAKIPLANPAPAVEDSTKNKWMSYLATAATAVGLLVVAKKIKDNMTGANSSAAGGNRSTASSGGTSGSGKIPKASEIPGHYTGKVTPKSNGVFGDGTWPQGDATSLVEQPEIRGLGYALGGDFDITVAADGKISGELVLWGSHCPIQSGQIPTGKYDVTFTIPGATGYFVFEAGGKVTGYVFEPGPPGHDWEGHKRGLISGRKK